MKEVGARNLIYSFTYQSTNLRKWSGKSTDYMYRKWESTVYVMWITIRVSYPIYRWVGSKFKYQVEEGIHHESIVTHSIGLTVPLFRSLVTTTRYDDGRNWGMVELAKLRIPTKFMYIDLKFLARLETLRKIFYLSNFFYRWSRLYAYII